MYCNFQASGSPRRLSGYSVRTMATPILGSRSHPAHNHVRPNFSDSIAVCAGRGNHMLAFGSDVADVFRLTFSETETCPLSAQGVTSSAWMLASSRRRAWSPVLPTAVSWPLAPASLRSFPLLRVSCCGQDTMAWCSQQKSQTRAWASRSL